MADIRLISTSTIRPSTPLQRKHIHLPIIDVRYLLFGPIQKGLLFPKPKSSEFIYQLQTSLSRTLDFFFPLAGRLATVHQDDNISFFVDCNNAGVQFLHATAQNVAVSDILEPLHFPPLLQSFFPMNGVKNYDAASKSKPLVAVQVTELADGVFIGFAVNHAVADGSTFWHFINSWSEISRGNSDKISKIPVFDNWFRDFPISLPLSSFGAVDEFPPPILEERIFHFSKQKIAELKERANKETGFEEMKISSLQSLLAHIWGSLTRCRQLDPEGETKLRFVIGLRSRLEPPIPEEYFGNAIQNASVTMKVKEVVNNGIGYAALEMNKTIASYTEDEVSNIVMSWRKNPYLVRLGGYRNALLVSSSPRFKVYGNDFGWGNPIAVRSGPSNKFDGMITAYEGIEGGSIDIEVCTLPQVLHAMGRDCRFIDAVTV